VSKKQNNAKKALAERMFIEESMTAKSISEALDVSEVTLSKWRNEESWESKRSELFTAPHKLREILLKQLQNIAEGGTSDIDADALSKINKVLENISDKISPQIVFSVFKEFDNWMASQDPKTAILFTHTISNSYFIKLRIIEIIRRTFQACC